jgi:hypothetical protein
MSATKDSCRDIEIRQPPPRTKREALDAVRPTDEDALRAWIEPHDSRDVRGLNVQSEHVGYLTADLREDLGRRHTYGNKRCQKSQCRPLVDELVTYPPEFVSSRWLQGGDLTRPRDPPLNSPRRLDERRVNRRA